MCGCEFNVAGAGGTIAGAVHGHFSSRSDISAIYHSAMRPLCCLETLLQVVEASPGGCGWWRLDQYIHVMAQLVSRLRCIKITWKIVISVI